MTRPYSDKALRPGKRPQLAADEDETRTARGESRVQTSQGQPPARIEHFSTKTSGEGGERKRPKDGDS